MKFLGVDPGYDRMGVSVLDGEKLVFSTCIFSKRNKKAEERVFDVACEFEKILKKHKPDVVAIEKVYFSKNQKTASTISEIIGIIKFLSLKNKVKDIITLTPQQIKLASSGTGSATKADVKQAMKIFFKIDTFEMIDDEVDAIATAFACSFLYKFHQKTSE